MQMPGRKFSQANSSYRYGFNGKEDDKDAGEGIQDYGMRIYDSRLGRFLSVDPLTKEYPWYTPYQFAGNKPIGAVDLDGLEEFWVTMSCFAPFDWFGCNWLGGCFSGDGENRKFGDGGTYRTSGTAHFDLLNASLVMDLIPGSTTSKYMKKGVIKNSVTSKTSMSLEEPVIKTYSDDYSSKSTSIRFETAGSNKASTSGQFVEINNHMNISFSESASAPNEIAVSGSVRGDRFPNGEAFIKDKNGTVIMLGASANNGPDKNKGPYVNLVGDNKRQMMNFSFTLLMDKTNQFVTGIKLGEKIMTIPEWNKQFTSLDTKDKTVRTVVTPDYTNLNYDGTEF